MDHTLCQWLRRTLVPLRTPPVTCQEARPPWAIEEKQFLALCNRCGDCFRACPQGLLHPADRAEYRGSAILRTPILDLSCGQCSYCGSCARACPTGALDLALGRQVQTRVRVSAQCQASLGYYCLLCEDACPRLAIKVTPQGVQLNHEACDGCGACGLACFHGAITLERHPKTKTEP